MLFRPQKKIKILFFTIQGVFPKRQEQVAEKLGKMISEELLSSKDIKDRLNDPKHVEVIRRSIESRIDDYLENTMPVHFPVMTMLLGKKTRYRIKDDLMKEVDILAPIAIARYIDNMENSFDVKEIIRQKVAVLSPIKLEGLIMGVLKKEFFFIEVIGGVIGFIIGVLQLLLTGLI